MNIDITLAGCEELKEQGFAVIINDGEVIDVVRESGEEQ